ncbi:TPA: ash family protein [Salmonella enterica subsp. diarizonae]
MLQATTDAPCVFFFVVSVATERHFMVWCAARRTEFISALYVTAHHITVSMVAQAGHPKGWPVSCNAGSSNPVWAIAIMKIGTFGDSVITLLQEVALWLRPSTRLTRNTPGFFWPFAVVICVINHTADRLQPLITLPHVALLRGITLPPLPGVFPAVRLLTRLIIPGTVIHLPILSRPDSGAVNSFLNILYAKEGISMTDKKNTPDEKVILLTDEHRNRPRTEHLPSLPNIVLSEEREQKLERVRRTVWFANDFLRKTPPTVEALFWLTEMLSYISDDLDDVMCEIRKNSQDGEE